MATPETHASERPAVRWNTWLDSDCSKAAASGDAEASQRRHGCDECRIWRTWAMPNSETFSVPPIGGFVQKYLLKSTVSVDPFARNKRWATHTNDLNPATAATHHMDAEDFLEMLAADGVTADLVIIDPPYSPRQVKECYDSIGLPMKQTDALLGLTRKRLKRAITKLVSVGGVVLHFGWNTVGMGKGWRTEEVLLVCHGSDHNDTICMAERRLEQDAELFPAVASEPTTLAAQERGSRDTTAQESNPAISCEEGAHNE